jgi:hypothetical protein
VVESSALLKRRTSKGYRGFESLPHRQLQERDSPITREKRWLKPNHGLVDAAGVADVPLSEAAEAGIVTMS